MKRITALFLLCSLLLCFFIPVSKASPAAAIPTEVLSAALANAQEESAQDTEIRLVPDAAINREKRLALDDNLILPAPTRKDAAMSPESSLTVEAILSRSAKAGQYYCTAVYRGDAPSGTPLNTHYGAFTGEPGLYEYLHYYHFDSDLAVGTYTIVYFTAVLDGNTLKPIEGSAFASNLYVSLYPASVQKLTIENWETGETLDKLQLEAGKAVLLAVGRTPTPSYAVRLNYATCTGPYSVEECNGLLILHSNGYGWGTLKIETSTYISVTIELNTCVDPNGHHEAEPVVIREPSATIDGLTIHTCTQCGAYMRETIPHYNSYYYKFVDVPEDAWYYSSVCSAVGKNLFRGVSTHHFRPEEKMTRAMLVTVLWRYEGSSDISGTPFTDVRASDWYAQPVAWAAQSGVVNGVGGGKFDPNGEVTREQMAAILYRYALKTGLDTSGRGDMSIFADGQDVSPWATDAVSWTVSCGIIGGAKEGGQLLLHAASGATRAEVAAILVRFIDRVADPLPEPGVVDPTGAEASGSTGNIDWAFFPDGTLVVNETPWIGTYELEIYKFPWEQYIPRIRTVKVVYGAKYLHQYCFRNYPALESVELPESLTTIDNYVFSGCTSLRHVQLPDSLQSIGYEAFYNCTSLEEIDLPDHLVTLRGYAFAGCTALQEIDLPDSLTEYYIAEQGLDYSVFFGCTSLKKAKLPVALERIPSGLFKGCTSLTEVEMPVMTDIISSGAFYGCESLESITLPPYLQKLSSKVFNSCPNLKQVVVPCWSLDFNRDGDPNLEGDNVPFGDPATVTVYGYRGSPVQELAEEFGYAFSYLPE